MRIAAPMLLALLLSACALGPNYRHPQTNVPPQWTAPATRGTRPGIEPTTDAWWKSFHDAELESLITRAAEANYDVKLSLARLEEARAATGIAKSSFYPQIGAGVSAERLRQIGVSVAPSRNPGSIPTQIFPYEISSYRGGFDASWEIDVFARIRRQAEAARADFRSSEQDRRNVLITVLGDVARYYAELRGLQLRLEIANKNVARAGDEVKLTRDLAQAGQVTQRDVAQAETQLQSTRAEIPQLNAAIETSIHRLSVLTGQQPGALDGELGAKFPLPMQPPEVPVGLPSDLLTRRPDIQSAQAQLDAAIARVGVAKADYFPTFTLFGSAGRQAAQLHELTLGLGNFFAAGPSISVPVFTGGRIHSKVAAEEARVREASAAYQERVLTSLEETENALVGYAEEQSRRDHLEATVRASQDALDLANAQYRAGLTDFLTVLDSERTLFANQDLLAQSQTSVATNLIGLYKALGGGWSLAPKI